MASGSGPFLCRTELRLTLGAHFCFLLAFSADLAVYAMSPFQKIGGLPANLLLISSGPEPLVTMFCPHYT